MKLKYTLPLAALAFTINAQGQSWIADTVNMEQGYAKNIYYSLENGSVRSEDANNWDIAIRANTFSAGVYANHAGKGALVYHLDGLSAAAVFGTDLTADTVGQTGADKALYNAIDTWEEGAFNADASGGDQFDFGWGEYDMASHWLTGDKVYLVVTSAGVYQVWIEKDETYNSTDYPVENPPTWIFHVANLDGTNRHDETLEINPDYGNKLFAYYDLESNEFVNRDPDNADWDLLFTQYDENLGTDESPFYYKVTGVLSNANRPIVKLAGEGVQGTAWDSTAMTPQFDSNDIHIIGREWKGSTNANSGYDIKDSLTYFVAVANGDIWQLEFTYASQGTTPESITPGQVGLRKRKVYTHPDTTTAINNINQNINNIVLAPNPAENGRTNILTDTKKALPNTQIIISDITGRVVFKATKDIPAGFQRLSLNVLNFTSGLYIINLVGNDWKSTQKLVIQ